jgi:hypothetical protein
MIASPLRLVQFPFSKEASPMSDALVCDTLWSVRGC